MNLRYAPHIAYIVIFLYFPLQLVFSQLPTDQINAMRKVYDMLQNDTATSFVWDRINKSSNPCSWKGISCNSNDNSSITNISFSLFSMSSSEVLPVICQINTLESLDISQNHLSSIPSGFITGCGGVTGLKLLNFSRNKLEGSLPNFTGFGKLESLDFSHNNLNGKVDLQLEGLDSLKSLKLSFNNFSGSVPTSLGKFNLLEELQLSANGFQGEFPTQIVNFGNLTLVDLSLNFLSGVIPDRLGELSKLQVLILSANNLSGTIPQSIGNIKTLMRFAANQNRFVGNIPLGLTSNNLRNLDLSFNNLTGIIPQDLLSPPNLQFVDLTSNNLEGPVPTNLSINSIRLRLGQNALNGSLPSASFGTLRSLTYLELDQNQLSGPIPSVLGKCQNLALLNLAQNKLSGVIPVELGDISNLQVLSLQSNNLVGDIPSNISLLNRLQTLNISWNSLNGPIPSSLSSLKNLRNLNLQGNKLSGQIPHDISNLNLLLELQLGGNQLGGVIPAMPLSLQIALNLSHNLFEGPIPITLSRLTSLEVLDLSYNRFPGQIPDFLTKMVGLARLVLSNNQLSGTRPVFGTFVIVETSGNRDLIYPSPITPPKAAKKRKSIVIAVVVPIAGVAVIALFTLIAISISRRYYWINDDHFHSGEEGSQSPVIQGKVLTANSIHKSNIDFTKAMVAVSDPLNVVFKTRFSTYYKVVMPSGTTYFVKKLNWSDKIFQLGSHELFGEELKNLGKLNNSNIMIPLGYLLAADSAYLFYEFAPIGTLYDVLRGSLGYSLDWASRYSIAIGVAQGLAFLHGCNSGPILLLDLSSKSVLLKSQNEAQIGDIEIYKVIDPSKSTGSFSAVAGSVGYIPPEYAYTMRVTMAGNVYSFGVVLLELLTGRPAVSQGTELAKLVLSDSEQHNKWDHILDYSICKTSLNVRSQMLAVLKVALVCVSISPEGRPKMKSVLRMLLNAR